MGGFSSTADVSSLAVAVDLDAVAALLADAETDTDTLLARIPAAAALSSDMATVLSRLSAARALILDNLATNTDMATVLSRLTATRAGYLDYLLSLNNGTFATAANLATASGYASTAAARGQVIIDAVAVVQAGITAGSIKSIQRGQIVWTAQTDVARNATITAVNLAKSYVILAGFQQSGTLSSFELSFTNSTTVTATRNAASSITATVGYQVVEFF